MRHALVPVLSVLLLSFAAPVPEAQAVELAKPLRAPGHFGIGFGGGATVSGFSMKYFAANGFAIQGVVGGWYGNGGGLGINADFLWEIPTLAMAGDVMELGACLGVGAVLGIGNDFYVGPSATAGLEFNFQPAPIDLVIEYKPAFVFGDWGADSVSFLFWNFGGHVRIYFM